MVCRRLPLALSSAPCRTSLYLIGSVLLLCAVIPSNGNVTLSPSEIMVKQGKIAEFNCTFNCLNTHDTIIWLVGHTRNRLFLVESAQQFTDATGLQVEVERITPSCRVLSERGVSNPLVTERIRINASSAELFNRTAVQCFVLPNQADGMRMYSQYSVLLINSTEKDIPTEECASPSMSPTPSPVASPATTVLPNVCPTPATVTSLLPMAVPTPTPCPSPVTHTQVVTTTKEVVIRVIPTSTPLADLINNLPEVCSQLLMSSSSSLSSLSVVTLLTLALALGAVLCHG